MESKVVFNADVALDDLGGGVARKVLAHLPQQMVVEVRFEVNGIGAVHSHPHTQCTYVCSGAFTFTVGGRDFTVRKGDTLAFAPNEPHGCICREAGVLIDVFTPMREDFVK